MRALALLLLGVGCKDYDVVITPEIGEDLCPDVETALAVDEVGPGGFSAAEVLASWGASWSPTVSWVEANIPWGDADPLSLELAPVEATPTWRAPADPEDPDCAGESGRLRFDVEATLAASALSDEAVATGELTATSSARADIRLRIGAVLSPTPALESALTDWLDARYADWQCPRAQDCADWGGDTWRLGAVGLQLSNSGQDTSAYVGVEAEMPDGSANGADALVGEWN